MAYYAVIDVDGNLIEVATVPPDVLPEGGRALPIPASTAIPLMTGNTTWDPTTRTSDPPEPPPAPPLRDVNERRLRNTGLAQDRLAALVDRLAGIDAALDDPDPDLAAVVRDMAIVQRRQQRLLTQLTRLLVGGAMLDDITDAVDP